MPDSIIFNPPHSDFVLAPAAGRIHMIGAGGAGMRALASVLHGQGHGLSGSDLAPLHPLADLFQRGMAVGHYAENIFPDTQLVIYSPAIASSNCELRQARAAGIPVIGYPEMLGRLMRHRTGIAVAGTHGKSTMTAMMADILQQAGCNATVVMGATPLNRLSGGWAGSDRVTLVEACEYRRSFLQLQPRLAAVLNIERDHFDYFRNWSDLKHAFRQFVDLVPAAGCVVANADCLTTRRIAGQHTGRVVTFGLRNAADWRATDLAHQRGLFGFNIAKRGSKLCRVQLGVPGLHNVQNALAAAALAGELGIGARPIAGGLESFAGLSRRLEALGTWRGVTVIDDFAHHPTEITAAIAAVRQMHGGRRICCVFQPHQLSRTRHLLDELAASLQNADLLVVADVFCARERLDCRATIMAAALALKIRQGGGACLDQHNPEAIAERLPVLLAPGDVLLTLGAGDIRKVSERVIDRLRRDRTAA